MTPQTLADAMDIPLFRAEQWAEPITEALQIGRCRTPEQQACALATWGHESAGLTRLVESFNYTPEALMRVWPKHFPNRQMAKFGRAVGRPADQAAIANIAYGGRMGNRDGCDGWKYRGRGIPQLTGRDNYRRMGLALGEPYESNPDLVAELPHAARVAGQYWLDNHLADYGGDILTVSRIYNIGTARTNKTPHGWADRKRRYGIALEALTAHESPRDAVRRMVG